MTSLTTVEEAQAHFAKRGVRFEGEKLVLPDDFEEGEMLMLLSWLKFFAKFWQFYFADCLRWLAERHGYEAMYQFSETLDYSKHTFQNILNVADKVPRENVVPGLTFRHYAAVAPLDADEQKPILDRAAPESPGAPPRMTSDAVREEVKIRQNERYATDHGKTVATVGGKGPVYESTICPHCGQEMYERVG